MEWHHQLNSLKTKKNPRIFLSSRKTKSKQKNKTKLKNKNGEIKTEVKEILKIAKEFWSDLHKKTPTNEQGQENFLNKYDKKNFK